MLDNWGNGRRVAEFGILVKFGWMSGKHYSIVCCVLVLATLERVKINGRSQSRREIILLSALNDLNCPPCIGETAGCQKKLLPIRWRLLCVYYPSCLLLKRPTHLANLATHLSAKLDKDKNLVGSRTVQIFSLHSFRRHWLFAPCVHFWFFSLHHGVWNVDLWSAPFSNICNFWARNLNW